MEKHANADSLWAAYSALAGLAQYSDIHPSKMREHVTPALNVLLSCLRAAGETCGNDYPE